MEKPFSRLSKIDRLGNLEKKLLPSQLFPLSFFLLYLAPFLPFPLNSEYIEKPSEEQLSIRLLLALMK